MVLGVFWSFAEERYAFTPGETGIVVLHGLSIEEGQIRIRIPSRGCTTKDDVLVEVTPSGTLQEGLPHYVVTFVRDVPDLCHESSSGDVSFIFDLQKDLQLEVPCALSVANPILLVPKAEELALCRDLIQATILALEREIQLYTESERADKEEKVALLEKELERFKKMKPMDYPLSDGEEVVYLGQFGVLTPPEVREVEVTSPPRAIGDILEVVGMTRSGPFYHVAGIRGGDFSVFAPSRRYRMTLYLVFRREYFGFIPSYYVYIASWEEVS